MRWTVAAVVSAEEQVALNAAVTAAQEKLDAAGEKACRACGDTMPTDASRCPWCHRRQGRVASGALSGARRRGFIELDATGGPGADGE